MQAETACLMPIRLLTKGDFVRLGPRVDSCVESRLASAGCASTTAYLFGLMVPRPRKIKPAPVASAPQVRSIDFGLISSD